MAPSNPQTGDELTERVKVLVFEGYIEREQIFTAREISEALGVSQERARLRMNKLAGYGFVYQDVDREVSVSRDYPGFTQARRITGLRPSSSGLVDHIRELRQELTLAKLRKEA
jgi:predicted ArsR family transcriptional regulator